MKYNFILTCAYHLYGKILCKKKGFEYEKVVLEDPTRPFILLCNHNTDSDGSLAFIAFYDYPMRFVMSEHAFRRKGLGLVLKYILKPITRQKGTRDIQTIRQIVNSIKEGTNVCMFAEGTRSPNGLPCHIEDSTGKLIRMSGADLITYKFTGGYFTQPRWARLFRKGRMTGELVNIYKSEDLKKMSVDEINQHIREDLYLDDYAQQKVRNVRFTGKALAEKMETVIHTCPKCHGIQTLESADDIVSCKCGYKVRYDEYGYLTGVDCDAIYDNVRDWYSFQQAELDKLLEEVDPDQIITTNDHQLLRKIVKQTDATIVDSGVSTVTRDKLTVGGTSFDLNDITDMAICDMDTIVFGIKEDTFEIVSEKGFYKNSYIYHHIYEHLKGRV